MKRVDEKIREYVSTMMERNHNRKAHPMSKAGKVALTGISLTLAIGLGSAYALAQSNPYPAQGDEITQTEIVDEAVEDTTVPDSTKIMPSDSSGGSTEESPDEAVDGEVSGATILGVEENDATSENSSGGDSTVSARASSSGGNNSSAAVAERTWVPEKGHWEKKQTGERYVPDKVREYTYYECQGCGFHTESEEEIVAHGHDMVVHMAETGDHSHGPTNFTAVPREEVLEYAHNEPVYSNVWVVDQPGHWE